MNKVQEWLQTTLENIQGKILTQEQILDISDRLEQLESQFGFRMLSDVWISSRSEEAEVPVHMGGKSFTVSVCLVPIPWRFESFGR